MRPSYQCQKFHDAINQIKREGHQPCLFIRIRATVIPIPVAAASITGAIGNSGTTVTAVSAVPLLVVSSGGFSLVPRIVTTILKLPVLSKLNV